MNRRTTGATPWRGSEVLSRSLNQSRGAVFCLVVFIIALSAAIGQAAASDLQREVQQIIRSAGALRDATIGVSVLDSETGRVHVAIRPDELFIPASNMKLLTSGAALHVLGPEFRFKTRVVRSGDDLIVIGSGDPGLGDPELLRPMQNSNGENLDIEGFLELWVKLLRQDGVTQVGRVLVDDSIFDRELVHNTWPADQLNRWYCAEVSGLNFHLNVLHFAPRFVQGGRPDVSNFRPAASWISPANRATSRSDQPATVWVSRVANSNSMTFFGNVRSTYSHDNPVRVTVHDMPEFFARLLAERLRRAGVQVDGHGVLTAMGTEDRSDGRGSLRERAELRYPNGLSEVGPVIVTPISSAVTRCNRDSQNMYAEALLKRIGHEVSGRPGSWQNGAAAMQQVIRERLNHSPLAEQVRIADGSGMSRHNMVSPALLTAWLNSFHHDSRLGEIFVESLAEPGGPGTLRQRFNNADLYGAEIHAKSGFINQVSCLSGFITMPDSRRMSFSVMCNDVPREATSHARNLQERIVAAIAQEMSRSMTLRPEALGSD